MKAIRKFLYVLRAGIKGSWQHRGMGIASISSIGAVLIILGFFLLTALGVNNVLGDMQYKVDDIDIFMDVQVPEEYLRNMQSILTSDPRVKEVYFKSSKDAMDSLKEDLGDKAALLDSLGDDILPASFNVKLKSIHDAEAFVAEFSLKQGVNTISYYKDLVIRINSLANYGKIAGLVIIGGLVLLAFFVISNTVKLTVIARRKEISVMRYVGARNIFITGPFLIEGIIFGIIGSLIALLVVYFGYQQIYDRGNEIMYQFFFSNLIRPENVLSDLMIIFGTLGISIGVIGSLFSMKRYLKA